MPDRQNKWIRGRDYTRPSEMADDRPFLTPRSHCEQNEEVPEADGASQTERFNRDLRKPNTGTR